jgi:hypothetical protein
VLVQGVAKETGQVETKCESQMRLPKRRHILIRIVSISVYAHENHYGTFAQCSMVRLTEVQLSKSSHRDELAILNLKDGLLSVTYCRYCREKRCHSRPEADLSVCCRCFRSRSIQTARQNRPGETSHATQVRPRLLGQSCILRGV